AGQVDDLSVSVVEARRRRRCGNLMNSPNVEIASRVTERKRRRRRRCPSRRTRKLDTGKQGDAIDGFLVSEPVAAHQRWRKAAAVQVDPYGAQSRPPQIAGSSVT